MYNRAKYHKNQIKEMKDAINIYKKWLKKYKKKKNIEDKKYPYMKNQQMNIMYQKQQEEQKKEKENYQEI